MLLRLLLGVLLLPCLSARSASDHDPAAALASFQVAAGFEVNLFASEKDGVIKPIQIRFDPRGRLWVIGSTVYPQIEPGQIPDDKVLILEDVDQDGVADKTTVFADGLTIPTGIELGDGGVYVGHGTELLFLQDTDGDDQADVRKVVLRGFGTGDNHQNINSFLFGPGGELWFCQGLHTHSNVETPHGIVRMNKAGLWRFRPRIKLLEAFYGSEFEPQNPWGWVFTDFGEPIVLAGNNHSHIYPVPGLTSSHKDLPPHLIWRNGQGRKSSGGDIVGTEHFPPEWQGVLLTGGYINNAIWALKILEDGAGYAIEDLPPLIRSTDRSFRPVDVKFGPDGALYVCDWYNPIIGHYQASFRHPDRDKNHGRIWRVTAKNRRLTPPPELHRATESALLDHLRSSDRWTRRFAQRALADRPGEGVVSQVIEWARDRNGRDLKEAVGVLQSHERPDLGLLTKLCSDPDPNARAYGAYVVGSWSDRITNGYTLLKPLVVDAHPRVRLHSIVAASYLKDARAIELVFTAAQPAGDKFIDYAANQAVYALKAQWLPALEASTLQSENLPEMVSFLVSRDDTGDSIGAVRRILGEGRAQGVGRTALVLALAEHSQAADVQWLLQSDLAEDLRVLKRLRQTAELRDIKPKDPAVSIQRLLLDADAAVASEAVRLAGIWRIEALQDEVGRFAEDRGMPRVLREAAIGSLGAYKQTNALAGFARAGSSIPIRASAIKALVPLNPELAAHHATALLADSFSGADSRASLADLMGAFLQRVHAADALAAAFHKQRPSVQSAQLLMELMNSSGRRHVPLTSYLHDLLGTVESRLTVAEAPAIAAEVRELGNAARGADIYRRAELGCVACHKVYGEGGSIGPELSTLGTAQPVDFIIGAILDPQKEVKEGYIATAVSLKNGDELQGYVVRETAELVVLRDTLQNSEVEIARKEMSSRRQIGSLMPAGLVDGLTRADFRDLVKYLTTLGTPRN